ncbi:MAG: 2Fe-2S iron-sulfur cluster-binding protein [Gammaproteobacteria bacterium]|nr:2Fe-2S iron-sulfur cluster-binding protein [Gammaproteobacteria bacterium]MCW8986730.1 2Fe-2S iron-sulfur cluster-binding protein [Gammaproteobacteria bacterium]MCW9031101.1 2Fe-2S iron-sulfur cluster-binding protein [Gammaproteobacteria bacterium]
MPRLVSLSRAAKLVGLSRGALQKRIHDLELQSFEGQVDLDDIEKMFPDVEIEDNHIIEDLEKIVEQALKRAHGAKLAKLLAPDSYTLAARLHSITKEHAHAKSQVKELIGLLSDVQTQISDLSKTSDTPIFFEDLNNFINDSIDKIQVPILKPAPLLEKDNLLRVMAAQVHIKNTGHEFFVDGSTTILEAGLSTGLAMNYGCSNGNCGKCKAKLISGEIKKTRPHDFVFSESEKLQNYFLCCSNTAITDIEIDAEEAGSEKDIPTQTISAKVKKATRISDDVLILNLKTPRTKRLRFIAGQNVILSRGDLAPLELPIASCPCDDMNIQFHIPQSDAPFSAYAYEEIKNSDSIHIKGPTGSFILDENSDNAIIFIAFDTGYAPINSLIEHAVTLEHAEFIHLYWVHTGEKPYMHNQCHAWEDALDNFKYQHVQYNDPTDTEQLTDIFNSLINEYSDFSDKNIYICGAKKMVKKTQEILLDHNADKKLMKHQSL